MQQAVTMTHCFSKLVSLILQGPICNLKCAHHCSWEWEVAQTAIDGRLYISLRLISRAWLLSGGTSQLLLLLLLPLRCLATRQSSTSSSFYQFAAFHESFEATSLERFLASDNADDIHWPLKVNLSTWNRVRISNEYIVTDRTSREHKEIGRVWSVSYFYISCPFIRPFDFAVSFKPPDVDCYICMDRDHSSPVNDSQCRSSRVSKDDNAVGLTSIPNRRQLVVDVTVGERHVIHASRQTG